MSIAGTHEKMGLRATSEAELAFDDVRIEPGDVLLAGDPDSNAAFRTLIGHINHERCGNAAMCIGAAQGALEYAIGYLNDRVVGGRPLADLQGLQWKIADMGTQLEGARLLLERAVHLAGPHGTPPALETAMAKTAANLAAKFVCDEAIQLLGGYGFSREYPVERTYRDIRGLCIGAGTVEIQKNFIGANLLRGMTPSGDAWIRAAPTTDGDRPRDVPPSACDGRTARPGGPWDVAPLPEVVGDAPRLAAGLRAAGVRRGDVVAWQAPNWPEVAELCRACWQLGAVAAPVHHLAGEAEVAALLAHLEPKLVLAPDELRDRVRVAQDRRRVPGARRAARGRGGDHLDRRIRGHAEGRDPHPPRAGPQGGHDGARPRAGRRRRGADARTARAHLRPAQRDPRARRGRDAHDPDGAVGPRRGARPDRRRAGELHDRPADLLRGAHGRVGLRARSGRVAPARVVGRRRRDTGLRRGGRARHSAPT